MSGKLTTLTKATELRNLRIDESSGVDDPANGVPGWLLIKAKDGDEPARESRPEGAVEKAMRGERAVIHSGEDRGTGSGLVRKAARAPGLIGAALRGPVAIPVRSSYEKR